MNGVIEEVSSFSFGDLNIKQEETLQKLFLLCKEGFKENALSVFHNNAQLLNKYSLSEIIQSEPVIYIIRREFRRLFKDIKVSDEKIRQILTSEVLKRDVLEGETLLEVKKSIKKAHSKLARESTKKIEQDGISNQA